MLVNECKRHVFVAKPFDTPVIENHGIPANWACLALGLRA